MSDPAPRVAIVDYGMGNLFSVRQACESVGLPAVITASAEEVLNASAVFLPGVGAFADAMTILRSLGLDTVIRQYAASGRPLVGICLGMQLLMTESYEFGRHAGLGIIQGAVVRFDRPTDGARRLKVPQVGWNRIFRTGSTGDPWRATPLAGLSDGVFLYFVHSYHVRVETAGVTIAVATYGDVEFCAAFRCGNVFACQAHPERSGPAGIAIYRNIASSLNAACSRTHD